MARAFLNYTIIALLYTVIKSTANNKCIINELTVCHVLLGRFYYPYEKHAQTEDY